MLKILLKFRIFYHCSPEKKKKKKGKFGKIKKIWVSLKILLKCKIFDHLGPAKHAIWQNQEI